MKKGKLKRAALVLCTVLASSLALTALSACGGGKGGGMQSTEQDSAPRTFAALSETEATNAYASNALKKEFDYLISLDSDKLLYWFYRNAGLKPIASSGYGGGWESTLIGGHTMGHYLSALALAYSNNGLTDDEHRQLKETADYVVDELKTCQDKAGTTSASKAGFLWGASLTSGGGTSNVEYGFDFVEQTGNGFSSNTWVPWYTMHKIIAGLYDVTVNMQNDTARSVLLSLCDWVCARVSKWSAGDRKNVLSVEYGGMNDILYSVYALTGEEKYAVAAHAFDEETLFEKIAEDGSNYLNDLHANTTIPKILGALNRYVTCDGKEIGGETVDASYYLEVAQLFFDRVVSAHSYVTGGNSEWERFGRDDVLDKERTNANCETCNTYNMLKLSRTLFTVTGQKKYLDYYENTYFNAIWSSQNPETGMTTYFQPMASGYFKVYSTPENSFWCCTGSGMESMSKLQDSIYYDAGNATYVSLYVSSKYTTDTVTLTQTADLEHSDEVNFHVDAGSTVLRLRVPDWTASYAVEHNGNAVEVSGDEQFVSLDVKAGDDIKLTLKKEVRAFNLPDGETTYAFKYGPFVLSAELGSDNMNTTILAGSANVSVPQTPVRVGEYSLATDNVADYMDEIDKHMTRTDDGKFCLVCQNGTLTYSIHYLQYTQRYAVYVKFAEGEVVEENPLWKWETADTRQVGYGQYETDLTGEDTSTASGNDAQTGSTTRYALANGSFGYGSLRVRKGADNCLVVSLAKADNGKSIKIVSGDKTLYENENLLYTGSEKIYAVNIPIPDALVNASNGTIAVTVSSTDGSTSARLCSFLYVRYLVLDEEYFKGSNALYFVDCGDYTPDNVSEGDKFGHYNSVTDQAYGADPVTGFLWGIVDEHPTNIGGATPTNVASGGVYTNSTWAYEQYYDHADASAIPLKTDTNRYTKNQFESGVARKLHYKFSLADGDYKVKMYFADPWGCSKNPNVWANGTAKITGGAVNTELFFNVTAANGALLLDITSEDLCINLCYIIIEKA